MSTETTALTKTLRDGREAVVTVVPDANSTHDAETTLSWYLVIQAGDQILGSAKVRPRELARPAGDLTHVLVVNEKPIGLTTAEADQVTSALSRWVAQRKQANAAAQEDRVARVRAAAPNASTWTISSPLSGPVEGDTLRVGGAMVTVLRAWEQHHAEDGWSFGVLGEAGTVYFAEVREATKDERAIEN